MAIKWKIEGQVHSLKGTTPENKIDIVQKGRENKMNSPPLQTSVSLLSIFH